jgi:hypothetical protein
MLIATVVTGAPRQRERPTWGNDLRCLYRKVDFISARAVAYTMVHLVGAGELSGHAREDHRSMEEKGEDQYDSGIFLARCRRAGNVLLAGFPDIFYVVGDVRSRRLLSFVVTGPLRSRWNGQNLSRPEAAPPTVSSAAFRSCPVVRRCLMAVAV